MKKLLTVLFALAVVLSVSFVVHSSRNHKESYVDFQTQVELLNTLFEISTNDRMRMYDNVPNVVFLGIPQIEENGFIIGVKDYPTEEVIQFILDFTGIPLDNVEFIHVEYMYVTDEIHQDN